AVAETVSGLVSQAVLESRRRVSEPLDLRLLGLQVLRVRVRSELGREVGQLRGRLVDVGLLRRARYVVCERRRDGDRGGRPEGDGRHERYSSGAKPHHVCPSREVWQKGAVKPFPRGVGTSGGLWLSGADSRT